MDCDADGKLEITTQAELDALLKDTNTRPITTKIRYLQIRILKEEEEPNIPQRWPNLPNLESLQIDGTHGKRIGERGCLAVAQALQHNACPHLKTLHLGGNSIGERGCEALAQALQHNACPHLTTLSLFLNSIGERGCEALAQALQHNACP
ncbi:MAG: hypothetical protein AAGJ35_14145, partial [Myxococcota bacterium]